MSSVRQEVVTCVICLDLLKEPCTLPCGHSYCLSCIQQQWQHQQSSRCPQCRQSFSPRPLLTKNIMMAALVEELQRLTTPPAERCYAAAGDVSCDVCTGRKLKAERSCLKCVASYCERHLQPHHEAAAFKSHQLMAPSHHLQENLCPQHHRLMEIFCRTDQQLLCSLCVDQHQGHNTLSSASERAQRQAQLPAQRALLLQSLQDKGTDLQRLRMQAKDIRRSAQTAVQLSGDSFREMALLLEKRRSEVEQQIRSQEKSELRRVQEIQNQLQQDMIELKRSISELDTMIQTPNHNDVILHRPRLSIEPHGTRSRIQTRPRTDFEDMSRDVFSLRDKLELTLQLRPEPDLCSREDFLKYAQDITLDANTAYTYLALSERDRRVTFMDESQGFLDHPDRFSEWWQVLSREELTGRCYWEVEWSSVEGVDIAVSYNDILRKGSDVGCYFGHNNKSWSLCCCQNSYSFWFNGVQSEVSDLVQSRIGVYLDHSAGTLSFYSVQGETLILLHTVQTEFTQPLCAGLRLCNYKDTVYFPQLRRHDKWITWSILLSTGKRVNTQNIYSFLV